MKRPIYLYGFILLLVVMGTCVLFFSVCGNTDLSESRRAARAGSVVATGGDVRESPSAAVAQSGSEGLGVERTTASSGRLVVRVVSQEGRPLSGARVCASTRDGEWNVVETAESGRGVMAISPDQELELIAWAPGCAATMVRAVPQEGEFTIALAPGSQLEVRVQGATGEAVADAMMRVSFLRREVGDEYRVFLVVSTLPVGRGDLKDLDAAGGLYRMSDRDGVVTFPNLPFGPIQITTAIADEVVDAADLDLNEALESHLVVLDPAYDMTVDLMDAFGVASAGTRVHLVCEAKERGATYVIAHAGTNPAGRAMFVARRIPLDAEVWACAGVDGLWGRSAAEAPSDGMELKVQLPHDEKRQWVTTIDVDGNPIRGARISCDPERVIGLFTLEVEDHEREGKVRLPAFFEGEALTVSASQGADANPKLAGQTSITLGAQEVSGVIRFGERTQFQMRGSLIVRLGRDASNLDGSLLTVTGAGLRSLINRRLPLVGGEVRVDGIREGMITLSVSHPQLGAWSGEVEIRNGEASVVVPEWERSASIRFSVADGATKAWRWRSVARSGTGSRGATIGFGVCARDEEVTTEMPPGLGTLYLSGADGDASEIVAMEFELSPGEVRDLGELSPVARGASVAVALDPPRRDLRVIVRNEEDLRWNLSQGSDRPRLTFRGLVPGTYLVFATDAEGKVVSQETVEILAEERIDVLLKGGTP